MTLVKIGQSTSLGKSLAVAKQHPLLQEFATAHETFTKELGALERVLREIQEMGPSAEANTALGTFFRFFDEQVIPHNRRQEHELFDVLHPLCPPKETKGDDQEGALAPVELFIEEHTHLIRMASAMFHLFGIAGHLPDRASQRIAIEAGIRQGEALVDMFRMHMMREDGLCSSAAVTEALVRRDQR